MAIKCEIYRDSMQNYKKYAIPPAQLIIADVPYNVGNNFYGSNPMWYKGGDRKNGESKLAGKAAFNSDFNFNLYEYFHFCSKMLKKEDKRPISRGRSSDSPCMIVFCSFEQIQTLINAAAKHGFVHYIPLVFCKNYSPQVLKANMRIVGATEYALVLYRDRLPKFRNGAQVDENGKTIRGTGHMVFNWFDGGNENEWGRTYGIIQITKAGFACSGSWIINLPSHTLISNTETCQRGYRSRKELILFRLGVICRSRTSRKGERENETRRKDR